MEQEVIVRTKDQLRPYQIRVVTRFYESASVLAVLKMGAGKTISALTAIEEMIGDTLIRHALVLAPKRVAELVWVQEAAAWEHTSTLDIEVAAGSPERRARILHGAATRDITVCGIDNAQWLVEQIESLSDDNRIFDLLVIDETSRFKDPKSKRGKALRSIIGRFKNVWGLTGTPRPNSAMDLWGPMQLVTRQQLWQRSFYAWQKEHFYMPDPYGYAWEPLPGHELILMGQAAPFTLTLGEDELPGLPELTVIEEQVELPGEARRAYDSMERRLFAGDIVAVNSAVATGKLAQIANGYVYGEGGSQSVTTLHDAKLSWLAEKKADLDGEPALLVYEFVEDRELIREVFGDIPFLGSDGHDAAGAVDAWNARKLPYLGLHPASGGHGLNLQHGGRRQLWISPPWSAELWEQTVARLHRPGQGEHVMIHVCMARDTVDYLKRDRVIGKMDAQAAFENYLRARGLRQRVDG
jgi:SNF2 family DNA or RNA helicase